MIKKTILFICMITALAMPCKNNAGIYDDVKRFVQTNGYYRALLSTLSVIYSYGVFEELIRGNLSNLDYRVQKAGAVTGSAVVLRLVDAHPGYATITLLGLLTYNLLRN